VDVSVYVHFPWCLQKCPYCDFASKGIDRASVPHEAYADAVLVELERRAREVTGARLVSVFFGGGTPSLWEPAQLGRVLAAVESVFVERAPSVEVTAECNPSSLDRTRAAGLRAAGVNRLSIGVQALDDRTLRFLGRMHDGDGALRALTDAVAEHDRVSADLMFGMPGQAPAAFFDAIDRVLSTGVEHVSAYALTIEPGTQFGELHRKGRLTLAPDDDYADMFVGAHERLERAGLGHYEVSNYGRAGREARHNVHYWRGGAYLGLGAGAVGRVGARRWRNDPEPSRYMERSARPDVEVFEETLGPEEVVREALMLGLRTRAGVDLDALERDAGVDPRRGRERAIARAIDTGDALLDGARLRVPPARWLHLDGIIARLF